MNISSNTKRVKWTLGCQADLMLDKLFAGNHPSIENPIPPNPCLSKILD